MAWIIQSEAQGPVIINDIGITLTHRQIRDLDIMGRENVERSNDLKLMIQKGFVREIRKDIHVPGQSQDVIQKINDSMVQHVKIAEAANQRMEQIEQTNADLHTKMDENNKLVATVLEEVRHFAESKPLDMKIIAEAMRNILSERGNIAVAKQELQESGLSDAEIKAKNRILELQDKKLEKNIKNLGDTISHPGSDLKDNLEALDKLNI